MSELLLYRFQFIYSLTDNNFLSSNAAFINLILILNIKGHGQCNNSNILVNKKCELFNNNNIICLSARYQCRNGVFMNLLSPFNVPESG